MKTHCILSKQHKKALQVYLDDLYYKYNRPEWISPDPLAFLSRYPDVRDRETAGLIAALLAYGRVDQIMKSVDVILNRLGAFPYKRIREADISFFYDVCDGFVHRFAKSGHMRALLSGICGVLRRYGSLEACFLSGQCPEDASIVPAMTRFVNQLRVKGDNGEEPGHFLPDPAKGCAMKRLNLFLRWMVRKDAVDPGGWEQVDPSRLIVPVDVHMHRISLFLGFTRKKTADMRMALEVTDAFRLFSPHDPVRYDFCLTRIGIRGLESEVEPLLRVW